MKLIKQIMMAALLLNTALLSACGGGGGGAPAAVAPTARAITTNTLRTFANGDNIQYTLTGAVDFGLGAINGTGAGSVSLTTNSSPPDLNGIVRSVQTVSLSGTLTNGTPFALNGAAYYSQDAAGNFNIFGDSVSGFITSPVSGFVLGLKSPIISPDSWVNSYTQQNGDTTTETITVLGKATVTTGMGTFETYKIQTVSTVTFFAGGTDVSTEIDYIVPSIGPVKMDIFESQTDAFGVFVISRHIIATASTTNIAF